MKMRGIKPEFWSARKVARLSRDARLLFIGMWNFSDDYGCCQSDARLLKAWIFPYDDDVGPEKVEAWRQELAGLDFIRDYRYGSESYSWIVNFEKHQFIPRKSKKRNPVPPDSIKAGM